MQREFAVDVMRLYGSMLRSISQLWELTIYRDAIVDRKMDATKEHAKKIEDEYMAARETTLTHWTRSKTLSQSPCGKSLGSWVSTS
jgi:hypothetical protein